MPISRPPQPGLAPFVELLWASIPANVAEPALPPREWVLPTGAMHIVIRLSDQPLRLFRDTDDQHGCQLSGSVIGGARSGPYLKAIAPPVPTVGAMLRPGAAEIILGAPASEFAHAHTCLEDVWGAGPVADIREQLAAAASAAERIDIFEAVLATRRAQVRGIDPMIARALVRLGASWRIGDIVEDVGCSHRHFAEVFRQLVGLKPKAFDRVLRFRRAVRRLSDERGLGWADLAAAEGYADQAHFGRDFRAMSGLTPGQYRRAAPASPHHVPVLQP